jgi:hypothetical protein
MKGGRQAEPGRDSLFPMPANDERFGLSLRISLLVFSFASRSQERQGRAKNTSSPVVWAAGVKRLGPLHRRRQVPSLRRPVDRIFFPVADPGPGSSPAGGGAAGRACC